jgi:hypothetical protein
MWLYSLSQPESRFLTSKTAPTHAALFFFARRPVPVDLGDPQTLLQVLCLCGFLKGLRDAFNGFVGQYRSYGKETAAVDQRIQCGQRAFAVLVRFGEFI